MSAPPFVMAPAHAWARYREEQASTKSRPARPLRPSPVRIVCVIPAHNEEDCIVETMLSVDRQSRLPDRRIVISDNSTDRTVALAQARPGWEVWETTANKGKKGGALNQAWDRLAGYLEDDDFLMTMDADTILDTHFVQNAHRRFEEKTAHGQKVGGICAIFNGRKLGTTLGLLQEMEYARTGVIAASRRGHVSVLAGAATVFSVAALREVHTHRGYLYKPVLVEDYELTLALRERGYETFGARVCQATTDVMPTLEALWNQRIRWYRGTIQELRRRGWSTATRSDIMTASFGVWAALMRWVFVLWFTLTMILVQSVYLYWWTAIPFGIIVLTRANGARRMGWRYVLLSAFFFEELYFMYIELIYLRAAWLAFFGRGERYW